MVRRAGSAPAQFVSRLTLTPCLPPKKEGSSLVKVEPVCTDMFMSLCSACRFLPATRANVSVGTRCSSFND